jgi:nicotinamidase-related amidase
MGPQRNLRPFFEGIFRLIFAGFTDLDYYLIMMKSLIIIDMQQSYFSKGWYDSTLISKINHRIDEVLAIGGLVIYVKNVAKHNGEPYISDFVEGLKVVGNNIFLKHAADAFTNPELDAFLKAQGVTSIEVVGIDGNACVYKTALGAGKAGYEVRYNMDCIGTKGKEIKEKTLLGLHEAGIII